MPARRPNPVPSSHFSYVSVTSMYRDSDDDFIVVFLATDASPLNGWDIHVENGYIKKIVDTISEGDVPAIEIVSMKVNSTHVDYPRDPKEDLGIKLPMLNLVIKNLNKYFTFEIVVRDDTNVKRKFRASNFQSTTRVKGHSCALPMQLSPGWNQIKLDMNDLVKRAYGTNYAETVRVSLFANCRIARIAFSDRVYAEDEVPGEYKLLQE